MSLLSLTPLPRGANFWASRPCPQCSRVACAATSTLLERAALVFGVETTTATGPRWPRCEPAGRARVNAVPALSQIGPFPPGFRGAPFSGFGFPGVQFPAAEKPGIVLLNVCGQVGSSLPWHGRHSAVRVWPRGRSLLSHLIPHHHGERGQWDSETETPSVELLLQLLVQLFYSIILALISYRASFVSETWLLLWAWGQTSCAEGSASPEVQVLGGLPICCHWSGGENPVQQSFEVALLSALCLVSPVPQGKWTLLPGTPPAPCQDFHYVVVRIKVFFLVDPFSPSIYEGSLGL